MLKTQKKNNDIKKKINIQGIWQLQTEEKRYVSWVVALWASNEMPKAFCVFRRSANLIKKNIYIFEKAKIVHKTRCQV